MLFSSVTFLYAFLPLVLLIYFVVPKKFRNAVLLLASLIFYFFGEPQYTILLLISSFSGWLHSLYIEKYRGTKKAKAALISSVIINLALLGFFKYADFLITTVNSILGTSIARLGIPLPVGISFYTFQTMSYTIDVYRGSVHAQRNLLTLATFVCLFPQLIAGPIVRYSDISVELESRKSTLPDISKGVRRFAVGLGKKILIANAMGELCNIFRQSGEKTVLFYWIYAVAFTIQIYFDFSGYSDMAIGLGKIFGFSFPENFNFPYIARSATEFWRRWHMTLSGWFRDYVYIPLGGNRTSKLKWVRNILVVWFLTGLWHGAEWNFIIWGLWYAAFLLLEKWFLGRALQKSGKIISHIYLLFITVIGFTIFNANGVSGALEDLGGMFGFAGVPAVGTESLYYLRSYGVLLVIAAVGATPLIRNLALRFENSKIMVVVEPVIVAFLLIACTASLINGSFNPFLYFRF